MTKPRLFFDTQIPVYDAREAIPYTEWTKVRRHVSAHYYEVVSPLTVVELLVGIAKRDHNHFDENGDAVRVLCPTLRPERFLRFPGEFLVQEVLGYHHPKPGFEPKDFVQWIRVLPKARDRLTLERGEVLLNSRRKKFGLGLASIKAHQQDGRDAHANQLHDLGHGNLLTPSKAAWARGILARRGVTSSVADDEKVASALDAAYEFDVSLWKLARSSNYDFVKHDSDWTDHQQLYYLCAADVHLVTSDQRLIRRTHATSQAARVMRYDDLRSLALGRRRNPASAA